MTKEQIIAMARELQWMELGANLWGASLEGAMSIYALERFAHLVAAAERERCAKVCDLLLTNKISSEWSRATHDCAAAIRALT